MAVLIVCFVPEMTSIFFVGQDSFNFDLMFRSQCDVKGSLFLFIIIMAVEAISLLSVKSS